MSHMQNRYHKAVDLDPVLTGQEKKCGGPRSGPKLVKKKNVVGLGPGLS